MASCTTGLIRLRKQKTFPVCSLDSSDNLTRLSTFSHIPANDRRRDMSAVLLAGSGITYSTEEDFLECIHCARITTIANAPATPTFFALTSYHQVNCPGLAVFIERKEREMREEAVNLHSIKRNYRRALRGNKDNVTYGELLQMYGITTRQM